LGGPLKDEKEEEEEGEVEDKRVDVVGPSDEIINSCSQLSQLSLKHVENITEESLLE